MRHQIPGLKVLTPPANEPVSLADIRFQCRIDVTDSSEDDFLLGEVTAARENIESTWDRALVSQRFLLTLDRFPGYGYNDYVLRMPRAPLQNIESVKYVSLTGDLTTIDPSTYRFDVTTDPGRLVPGYGQFWPWFWPPTLREIRAVEITYVAGYGPVTTSTTGVSAAGDTAVTPASMFGIYVGTVLGCDNGAYREWVTVTSVSSTTFNATFARTHSAGFPINCTPRGYQSAIRMKVFDKYQNRGNTPPLGSTGVPLSDGADALLQALAHGEIF